MTRRWSTILPVGMGLFSAGLVVWDVHNLRVIEKMGMAWDTGAPVWPYQTPDILLFAVNFPAYFIAAPILWFPSFNLLGPRRDLILLLSLVIWWWLVGMYFDRWKQKIDNSAGSTGTYLLLIAGTLLLLLGAVDLPSVIRWWWIYGRDIFSASDLILLRFIAPIVWCFTLGTRC